jgi:hypothetical protein
LWVNFGRRFDLNINKITLPDLAFGFLGISECKTHSRRFIMKSILRLWSMLFLGLFLATPGWAMDRAEVQSIVANIMGHAMPTIHSRAADVLLTSENHGYEINIEDYGQGYELRRAGQMPMDKAVFLEDAFMEDMQNLERQMKSQPVDEEMDFPFTGLSLRSMRVTDIRPVVRDDAYQVSYKWMDSMSDNSQTLRIKIPFEIDVAWTLRWGTEVHDDDPYRGRNGTMNQTFFYNANVLVEIASKDGEIIKQHVQDYSPHVTDKEAVVMKGSEYTDANELSDAVLVGLLDQFIETAKTDEFHADDKTISEAKEYRDRISERPKVMAASAIDNFSETINSLISDHIEYSLVEPLSAAVNEVLYTNAPAPVWD